MGDVPDQIIWCLSHSHGLTLRCRDEFQLEPVSLTVNPPPGLIAHDLTPSCLDVLVRWESGGQVCQMWHLRVNVFTNVGFNVLILGRLNRYAYFRRGDLFSCSHLWAAVYFKPFKSHIQKMHYPYIFPSFWLFQETVRFPAYLTLQCLPRDPTMSHHCTHFCPCPRTPTVSLVPSAQRTIFHSAFRTWIR